jgi:2-oxo-4-hydroxy-4-carboxy-5-ureidoimidazoline decarboxylase
MPKLAELNALSREDFTRLVAPVFEHSPWVAARTCAQRPFASREDLQAALCDTVMKASDEEKIALIRAHPDLGERAALTSASKNEQASAGLDRASGDELARLRELNRMYREHFGFPFVICAREHKKEEIVPVIQARLANSRAQEIDNSLREVFKIADLRLRDLMT